MRDDGVNCKYNFFYLILCIRSHVKLIDVTGMYTHMHGITFGKMVLVKDQHSLQMQGTKYVKKCHRFTAA